MRPKNPFKLVLCPTRDPDKKYLDTYQKIYNCWNDIWSTAYAEAKQQSDEDLRSDNFTRQDFTAALFYEDECAAIILFRYVDTDIATTYKDSFFEHWSEIHRKAVSRMGKKLLVCGNMGVAEKFRNKSLGFSVRDLMIGVVTEIALQTNADVTLSTPRRDKNVQGAAYKWGVTPIAQNVPWGYGIDIDLVVFEKTHLAKTRLDHELINHISELWENKTIIDKNQLESLQDFKNTDSFNTKTSVNRKRSA